MSEMENKIIDLLNAAGVKYQLFEHEPVYTCPQMAEFLATDQNLIAKSMIMKGADSGCFLVVLPGKMRIDYSRLARVVGTKSVSLAPVEEAQSIAGCSVGCVHPFGNLIGLETYFDKKLLRYEHLFFNPGSHTKSVKIATHALIEIVKPTINEFAEPARRE